MIQKNKNSKIPDKYNQNLSTESLKKMLLHLYVSQIPYKTSEDEIQNYFSNFGTVKNLSIAKGKGNWNKLNAKIDLQTSCSFRSLMSKKHILGGKRVLMDRFLTGNELEKKNKSVENRRVSVFGIKGGLTSKDVLHYLRCFGEIESHHFIKYKDKRNKKYGFVTFAKEESARKCVGCQTIDINGIPIKIKPYKKKRSDDSESEFSSPANSPFSTSQRPRFTPVLSSGADSQGFTDPSPNLTKRKKFNRKKHKRQEESGSYPLKQLMNQYSHRRIAGPEFVKSKKNNTMKEILEVSSWNQQYHSRSNLRLNKETENVHINNWRSNEQFCGYRAVY